MYPVKGVRAIKTGLGTKYKNVCIAKSGREIVYHADGYYHLNKDNSISKTRCKD